MTLIGYRKNIMNTIPFDKIKRFGQSTLLSGNLFNVSWILGRFCNYKCSYCWPYANTDVPDHLSLEVYKNSIDEIKRQARINGYTDFHFSFSGGEPTAYKDFGPLIQYYAEDTQPKYQSLHMTTNLSPGSKWWNRWLDATSTLQRRSITASFHAEFANEQEFGDKCLQLINNDVYVTINQVMVPDKFDEYYERCDRFWRRGINVTLKPQSDPTASYIVDGYRPDQIALLQQNFKKQWQGQEVGAVSLFDHDGKLYELDEAERFNAFGFNKFKGWKCNAGYQSCIVRGNEVKRAYSCSEQALGTLTDGFSLFDSAKPCVTDTCVSSADSKIPKERYAS